MSRRHLDSTLGAAARAVAGQQGFVVHARVRPDSPDSFPLVAVRTGPESPLPVLIIAGGPGLASVLPYAWLRASAARLGLDVIMAEHRGVGLSRRDSHGRDLPVEAVTVASAADDLRAVLDAASVTQAVVYGSSYGSHLAQAFAARHPDRVAAMVLDSPLLSPEDDLAAVRRHRRRLLWEGQEPALAPVARTIRELAAEGVPMDELSQVVQTVYESAGPVVLQRFLRAFLRGRLRRTWQQVLRLGSGDLKEGVPYFMEPALVSGIAFGEMGFGLPADGGPLDPQLHFADVASEQPPYHGQSFDPNACLREFPRLLVVVSGDRDLRTPPPIAQQAVNQAPNAVLVSLRNQGHSALDSHHLAALHIARAVVGGAGHDLPAQADRLSSLPRRGSSGLIGPALRTATGISAITAARTGRRRASPEQGRDARHQDND